MTDASTMAPSGADFDEIDDWVSYVQGSLVSGGSLTDHVTLDVTGGVTPTSSDTVSGWNSGGGTYTTTITSSVNSWADHPDVETNAYTYNSANGAYIDYSGSSTYKLNIQVDKCVISRLQILFAEGGYTNFINVTANNFTAFSNIFTMTGAVGGGYSIIRLEPGVSIIANIYNNLFRVNGSRGCSISFNDVAVDVKIRYNLFVRPTHGEACIGISFGSYGDSQVNFDNNAFVNLGTQMNQGSHGTEHTANNNATSTASWNSNGFVSPIASVFSLNLVDEYEGGSGMTDCRVKATSTQLKNGGTPITGITTDARGKPRHLTAPTIGPWEASDGGSTDYPLDADGATFTVSGQAASLLRSRAMAANSGPFTLAGQAATLRRGYPLAAGNGGFAFAGQTVAFMRGLKTVAQSGSFAFAGQNATLTKGGGNALSAGNGTFTLTGQGASLLLGRKVGAGNGVFTFSGQSASLGKGRALSAGNGAVSLSGQPVTFGRTYILSMNTGAFALNASDTRLHWSGQSIWAPQAPGTADWVPQSAAPNDWTVQ